LIKFVSLAVFSGQILLTCRALRAAGRHIHNTTDRCIIALENE